MDGNVEILHRRIFEELQMQILDGAFEPGEKLPSEAAMCAHYGVSRTTVRRALDRLESLRLVERQQGKRACVAPFDVHAPLSVSSSAIRLNDMAIAKATTVVVLAFDTVNASLDVAQAMSVPVGTRMQYSVRLRTTAAGPVSYNIAYVPLWLGGRWERRDLIEHPMRDLLAREGVKVQQMVQTLSAKSATPTVAAALDLTPGAPVVSNSRIVFDTEGRVVEFIEALLNPARYQFQFVSEE
jgi:GntR family transcriptional regulator